MADALQQPNGKSMNNLTWKDFMKVDLRVGTIVDVQPFPEARKPAWKLWVDFGEALGVKRSSAQITRHYKREDLVGKQVIAVVNFPPKQIGPFLSDCLVTGFPVEQNAVVLTIPERAVPNGSRLF
jgi:tRNA-binding protein